MEISGISSSSMINTISSAQTKAGGIGLADMLYRQLHTSVSVSNKSQAPK